MKYLETHADEGTGPPLVLVDNHILVVENGIVHDKSGTSEVAHGEIIDDSKPFIKNHIEANMLSLFILTIQNHLIAIIDHNSWQQRSVEQPFSTQHEVIAVATTETIDKLKATLKKLTGRSNGMGYKQRKEALNLFIRGWVEYYKMARMKKTLETIDMWLRRRIRMCIWKSWKNPRTRIANLIKCGVPKWRAYKHGWVKGYWRAAGMWDCTHAMSNRNLYRAGYRCLMDYYVLVS